MIERVIDIIKLKAKSVREFADSVGIKQVTLNQQLNGDRKLSLDTVLSILNSFDDISAEWLLRGEGEMYKADDKNINDNFDNSQYVSKSKYESTVYLLAEVTNNLKETVLENKKLYEENKELRSQLKISKSA
jgi:plasmid maintenance system antidote protein VapI